MQYLLLIYNDEKLWAPETKTDPSVLQAITAAHMRLGAELSEAGAMVGGNRLQPTDTATTVRTVGGSQSLHDGPYAETREQLAGYYLIEARDLNEAIQVASGIPGAKTGSIEVRPVRSMPQFEPLYQQAVTA